MQKILSMLLCVWLSGCSDNNIVDGPVALPADAASPDAAKPDASSMAGGPRGGAPMAAAAMRDAAIDARSDVEDAGVELPDAAAEASTPDAAAPPDPAVEAMHARADALLQTLMLRFWSTLSANTTTYDWMYAHYWDAVLDATERRGANAFAGTARMFYELQQKRGWLDGFYDDENWVTLALLHAYEVTREPMYLEQAKVVFADIELAWDETCCGDHKGGLWWKKPNIDKVTAINAGAVISAARLYGYTRDDAYLAFARKAYDFWSTHMVDQTSGHVYDGFNNQGVINKDWKFTYNEGLFIGAIVELARVTGDNSQIPLAHKVAAFMLREESAATPLGTILSDGKCSGDGEMFKAVGARYLGELYAFDPAHSEYREILRRSADAVWSYARDPASGLVSCDWSGPFDMAGARVGALGSAAVGVAAAAKALGPGTQRPALQYEAEEGNLHGVGLEAQYQGFSGWGYPAGWGNDGQSVDLLVDVAEAGTYSLDLRYASTMAAQRTLTIQGSAPLTLQLASTGDYTQYRDLTREVVLGRGRNQVTLGLDAQRGDMGYINWDRVVVKPRP